MLRGYNGNLDFFCTYLYTFLVGGLGGGLSAVACCAVEWDCLGGREHSTSGPLAHYCLLLCIILAQVMW